MRKQTNQLYEICQVWGINIYFTSKTLSGGTVECTVSLIFAVRWLVRQLDGQRCEQVCPHQEQDLWMPDESQRSGELPAGAATVAVSNDVAVVAQLQPLQQILHHL